MCHFYRYFYVIDGNLFNIIADLYHLLQTSLFLINIHLKSNCYCYRLYYFLCMFGIALSHCLKLNEIYCLYYVFRLSDFYHFFKESHLFNEDSFIIYQSNFFLELKQTK